MYVARHLKGYEEVKVPAAKKGEPGPGEKMVLVEEMEEWAQLAFSGYKCARFHAAF